MPIIASAKKQLRQNIKNKSRNDRTKSLYREARVTFEKAIKSADKKAATDLLPKLYSTIDTLNKKNLIHKNNAARKKSAYARQLKDLCLAK